MLSILQAAGWPIIPLLLASIVALALIVERWLSLRVARIAPPTLVDEVIGVTKSHLPTNDTIQKLADNSLLGRVLAEGFKVAANEPRAPEARLRQALESAGRDAVHAMEHYLNALGTIASAAPMMGLLGTVIGMIEIFGASGGGTGGGTDPTQLAHGISIALYNTAFGLIVAIPALMFYRHFRAKVEAYTLTLEQAAERMVPHLLKLTGGRR
ncbi:MotA/TolQ/ExbB proton channel family protein [Aquabacterium sp. A3]|uniref:MotA/TolQ/ExbB proton channel family protein n=1 Tax=Aquabacterium sp. A3 TaxID=3132829 RepID=UPI003119F178